MVVPQKYRDYLVFTTGDSICADLHGNKCGLISREGMHLVYFGVRKRNPLELENRVILEMRELKKGISLFCI